MLKEFLLVYLLYQQPYGDIVQITGFNRPYQPVKVMILIEKVF